MLTALRIINLIVWLALLAYVLPAAKTVVADKDVRRGDPWRLGVAGVCVVMILSNIRWLLFSDNTPLFLAVYVLSAIVGIYKIILARSYGRGPKL